MSTATVPTLEEITEYFKEKNYTSYSWHRYQKKSNFMIKYWEDYRSYDKNKRIIVRMTALVRKVREGDYWIYYLTLYYKDNVMNFRFPREWAAKSFCDFLWRSIEDKYILVVDNELIIAAEYEYWKWKTND